MPCLLCRVSVALGVGGHHVCHCPGLCLRVKVGLPPVARRTVVRGVAFAGRGCEALQVRDPRDDHCHVPDIGHAVVINTMGNEFPRANGSSNICQCCCKLWVLWRGSFDGPDANQPCTNHNEAKGLVDSKQTHRHAGARQTAGLHTGHAAKNADRHAYAHVQKKVLAGALVCSEESAGRCTRVDVAHTHAHETRAWAGQQPVACLVAARTRHPRR